MLSRFLIIPLVAVAAAPYAIAETASRIEIRVSQTGVISVAGRTVTVQELAEHLKAVVKKDSPPEALIVASERTPLEVMTSVLRELRASGISRFSIQSS